MSAPQLCHHGAGMLGRRDLCVSALDAIHEALGFVRALAPFERSVSDEDWLALTRISLLLATFDTVVRSRLAPAFAAELGDVPSGLHAWTRLACTQADLEDVAALGRAAAEDHADLCARPMCCNPIFTQSIALGGADADLVTDQGLLVDFKSTGTTRVCSRDDLWQLCGYALADTDDDYAITNVGLSVLRWRARVTWPLSDLLSQLAGGPVDLPTLRRDFAARLQ